MFHPHMRESQRADRSGPWLGGEPGHRCDPPAGDKDNRTRVSAQRASALEEIAAHQEALEGRSVRVLMTHVEHDEQLFTEYIVP